MVDDIHFLTDAFIVSGGLDEPLIGIIQQFVDIAQIRHLLLHPQQQLLLGIPKLLRFHLYLLKRLLQPLSVFIVLLHYGEELFQWDLHWELDFCAFFAVVAADVVGKLAYYVA